MKFDPQKAYPYPVLRPMSGDFSGVEFQTAMSMSVDQAQGVLTATIMFELSSDEILREINAGKAAFFITFACRNTYFRKSFRSLNQEMEVKLELSNLRDEVSVEPYVVAVSEIEWFASPDVNPEFGEGPFRYETGNILAQDEHQSFYINRDVFKPVTSVFDLVKKGSLAEAEWSVGLDQDHVEIAVSPQMKDTIDGARNSTANKAILINSIYFSAVMQAVQALHDGEEFDDYKWAKVIRQKTANAGLDMESSPAYYIAEHLMSLPLSLLDTYVFKGE